MKHKSSLLWFVLLLSMSSCLVSYENLSIEVLKPATFTLPENIRKIALVSRNLKYDNDTLQNYQVLNRKLIKDKIKFNVDSLSQLICMDSLAAKLLTHKNIDSVLVLPVNSFPIIRVQKVKLDKAEWYKYLANETRADGLIVLDMLSSFYSRPKVINSTPYANVITYNIWSIYDCKKQKIIDHFVKVDTLYWDGIDESGVFKMHRLPEKKEAVLIAAGIAGENYVKRILPTWNMVYRDIMTCNNPIFKKAAKLASQNKWEEASSFWQINKESKRKLYRIISLYNLAVSSEMIGDIDQAIKYTDQAAQTSIGRFWSVENESVRQYSAVLYQRKNEIDKLKVQYDHR